MLRSDKYKFVFVAIPKTGTSSIIGASKKFFEAKLPSGGGGHDQIIPSKFSDYYKFTVVRNPYDRAVSAWQSSTQRNNGDRYGFKAKMDSSNSFRSFCKEILKSGNALVKPQHFWLAKNNFNKILRFENLDNEWLSLEFNNNGVKLPHINKSNHKHYSEYYDEETRSIVEKVYEKDFDILNYKYENK